MAERVEQTVVMWKSKSGRLFATEPEAIGHDAKQLLYDRLVAVISVNGLHNADLVKKIINRHRNIALYLEEYRKTMDSLNGPE